MAEWTFVWSSSRQDVSLGPSLNLAAKDCEGLKSLR